MGRDARQSQRIRRGLLYASNVYPFFINSQSSMNDLGSVWLEQNCNLGLAWLKEFR